uniref:Uncharacterized protein n=1 Tax=Rhizophora mucronata TaxID=61149 RepID=A0A2P2PRC4_RHIMU
MDITMIPSTIIITRILMINQIWVFINLLLGGLWW